MDTPPHARTFRPLSCAALTDGMIFPAPIIRHHSKQILHPDVPHSLRLQGILIGEHYSGSGATTVIFACQSAACRRRPAPPCSRLTSSAARRQIQTGGVVIVFSKQQIYLLEDLQDMVRKVKAAAADADAAAAAAGSGIAAGAGAATLLQKGKDKAR